jgi:hypothetical protein
MFKITDKKIMIFLALFTVFVFLMDGFMEFPILTDNGLFSYISQDLLDGKSIYSTPDIKGPMVYIFNAAFMTLFSFLPNWLAIRVGMMVMSVALILLFYKVCLYFFKYRLIAIASCFVILSFDFFVQFASIGDPKILAVFFHIMCWYFISKKKYLASGASAGFAFLSWQPAGIVLLAPIIFSNVVENKIHFNYRNVAKSIVGFSISMILMLIYFVFAGAIDNFIQFSFILPIAYKSLFIERLTLSNFYIAFAYFGSELLFFVAAGLGFIYYAIKKSKLIVNGTKIIDNSILFFIPYILLFVYTIFDFVSGDDFFIFFIPMSILSSLFLLDVSKKLFRGIPHRKVVSIVLIFILVYGFHTIFQPLYPENPIISTRHDASSYGETNTIKSIQERYGFFNSIIMFLGIRMGEEGTLSHQLEVANYIRNNTDENDAVLSLSAPEILFLAGKKNPNDYPLIESYVFIFYLEENGKFEEFKQNILKDDPKFIVLEKSSFWRDPNVMEILEIDDDIERDYREVDFVKYIIYERV